MTSKKKAEAQTPEQVKPDSIAAGKGNQDRKIAALERKMKALELRKAGVDYMTIAKRLGYASASGAHNAVKAALKLTLQEPADDLRKLELERIDAALSAIWTQVMKGNHGAVDRFIRLSERRARLIGLDAPQKIEANLSEKPKLLVDV